MKPSKRFGISAGVKDGALGEVYKDKASMQTTCINVYINATHSLYAEFFSYTIFNKSYSVF